MGDMITSKHMQKTSLTVDQASAGVSTVRLESLGGMDSVMKVSERTTDYVIKLDLNTAVCMREVLNAWYDREIEKRGR